MSSPGNHASPSEPAEESLAQPSSAIHTRTSSNTGSAAIAPGQSQANWSPSVQPGSGTIGTPALPQIPLPGQTAAGDSSAPSHTPLAGLGDASTGGGPGKSALAAALETKYANTPPRFGTPPMRPTSPPIGPWPVAGGNELLATSPSAAGGIEDPDIVKRHLVMPHNETPGSNEMSAVNSVKGGNEHLKDNAAAVDAPDLDEFSSLQLQGGDVHRQIYRWAEESDPNRHRRTKSYYQPRPEPENPVEDINSIMVPGGFRRDFLRRQDGSPAPSSRYGSVSGGHHVHHASETGIPHRQLPTNSFLEFLTLYGHFAGEELEDHDETEADEPSRPESLLEGEVHERSALLGRRGTGRSGRFRKQKTPRGNTTPTGAALLLLKSFVGTGVLFLPRAFLNGGMMFSSLGLLFVAAVSYYCFILLVTTRLRVEASYGDMGGIIWGRAMRFMILGSIVLSQVGFVAAYIVFTSENMQAFIIAVSKCATWIDIKYMVLMQLIVFLPLSLIRDIGKLGFTALVADVFILLGLVYLYYFDISTIAAQGAPDIVNFNSRDWTLFVGTAIFTFEGIGLIIPIQESMRNPAQFPPVLAGVMVIITVVFTTIGAFSYAAFGSDTKTVVLLSLPQDSKFVNAVQFLYSIAILLSTPLQLFPAIRILETEIFTRSGKYNPWIKWRKNAFRFCLVCVCALMAWGGARDLDKFVSLVGSFACVPLVYVYPPLLHYRAVASTRLQRISDLVLSGFGFAVMAYATTLTVVNWASYTSPPNGPPDRCL